MLLSCYEDRSECCVGIITERKMLIIMNALKNIKKKLRENANNYEGNIWRKMSMTMMLRGKQENILMLINTDNCLYLIVSLITSEKDKRNTELKDMSYIFPPN